MFEKAVKQSLSQSPEDARRQTTSAIVSTMFYLYSPEVATYRFANAISTKYRRFSLPPVI